MFEYKLHECSLNCLLNLVVLRSFISMLNQVSDIGSRDLVGSKLYSYIKYFFVFGKQGFISTTAFIILS
jgi:hypothetical protein